MPTSGRLCPRSRVIDCGSAPDTCQIVLDALSFRPSMAFLAVPLVAVADTGVYGRSTCGHALSFRPSMAFLAVPLVAVADTGVYGRSTCGPCGGKAGRAAFGVQAAPTCAKRLTMVASISPSRLGGQLRTKLVHSGSSFLRWSSTIE